MKGKQAQLCEPKIKAAKAEAPSVLHIPNKHTQHNALPRGDFQAKSPAVAVPPRLCLEGLPTPGTHGQFPSPGCAQEDHKDYPKLVRQLTNIPFAREGKVPTLVTHGMSFGTAAPLRAGALLLPNIIPVMALMALGWFSPAGQVDLPLSPFSLSAPVAADGAQFPATARLYLAPAPHAEMFSRETQFLWVFNTLCLPSCLL